MALGSACIINIVNASPWDEVDGVTSSFFGFIAEIIIIIIVVIIRLFLTMYISGQYSQMARSSPTRPPAA